MNFKFSNEIKTCKIKFAVVSVMITILAIILESITKKFIDQPLIIYRFWVIIFLYLIFSILRYGKKYLELYMNKKGKFEGQLVGYNNILSKNNAFSSDSKAGILLYNITEDIYVMMPWFTYGKLQLGLELLNLILLFIFMMFVELKLAVIVSIFILLSLFLSGKLSSRLARKINSRQRMNSDLNQFMVETIKSISTIKQLNKSKYFSLKYGEYLDERYKPIVKNVIFSQAIYISQLIFSQEIIPFITLFIGMIFVLFGNTTIGATIIMMDLTVRISTSVQSIGDLLQEKHSAEEIYKSINKAISEGNTDLEKMKKDVKIFESLAVRIESYEFHKGEDSILNNIDFEVIKGDICVLKGESGAGKTTLLKLISRFLTTKNLNGDILYNGCKIDDLKQFDYYKHVLLVEQNTFLISGTVKDNLIMDHEFSDKEIQEVLYVCGLNEFISTKGFDYEIKEDGKNISGGERQRIGLARILLHKPEVLLLDEVTSSLNKKLRDELVHHLATYSKKYNITIIAISHNNDFDKYSNKIIEVNNR